MCLQTHEPSFILIDGFSALDEIKNRYEGYLVTEDRGLIINFDMSIVSHFQNPTQEIPLASVIDNAHVYVLIGKPAYDRNTTTLTEWLKTNRKPFDNPVGITINSITDPSLIEPEVIDEMTKYGLQGYAKYIMQLIWFFWLQKQIQTTGR